MNRLDIAAELERIAKDLETLEWLKGQVDPIPDAVLRSRLVWLNAEARAGREHHLPCFLGNETYVRVAHGDLLVRRYVGVDLREL